MADILRDVEVREPGTLKVGGAGEATALAEILHGQVTVDLGINGNIAGSGGIQSASAVFSAMTADHRVVVLQSAVAAADAPLVITAAQGIAGGFTMTAMNASASAINPASSVINFFAWR